MTALPLSTAEDKLVSRTSPGHRPIPWGKPLVNMSAGHVECTPNDRNAEMPNAKGRESKVVTCVESWGLQPSSQILALGPLN